MGQKRREWEVRGSVGREKELELGLILMNYIL